jgi:hypothetical protein
VDRERVVERGTEGGWSVRAPDAARVSSYHARQNEAVARAKTILRQAGGGKWSVRDAQGHEISSGTV